MIMNYRKEGNNMSRGWIIRFHSNATHYFKVPQKKRKRKRLDRKEEEMSELSLIKKKTRTMAICIAVNKAQMDRGNKLKHPFA